jgi:hypothetical protein
VRRFRYWQDPLCLTGGALYVLNRFLVKPHVHSSFFHGHFNDLLLIPCALPLVLGLQRWLGWRRHDGPPTPWEILFHLAVWSVLFEWIGPHLLPVTGDPWDVLAYAVGAAAAALWWHFDALRKFTVA